MEYRRRQKKSYGLYMESEDENCGCIAKKRKSSVKNLKAESEKFSRPITLPISPVANSEFFYGKRILVTGATRGIGKNLVKNLSFLGAQVIAVGRAEADLETLCAEITGIIPLVLDVSKWTAVERKLSNIGDFDHLVNCGGVTFMGSMFNITEDQYDEMFDTNTKGLFNITKIFAHLLIRRKAQGSIVSISSQSATYGMRKLALFGASKAAVEGFTRAAALELSPYGIRINCISPSVISTKTSRTMWSKQRDIKNMMAKMPMKRFGEIHEVVQGILFLLSDKSNMITGYTMPVDGGFSAC